MQKQPQIAVIHAEYYQHIDKMLVDGAQQALAQQSAQAHLISVPGALEIPIALNMIITSRRYDGAILLGCVIRGETSHYDHVCHESIAGATRLAIDTQFPMGNAILTVENEQQAIARADPKQGNKAADAVAACMGLYHIAKNHKIAT